jgi:predicted GIY-YIG superfamily endonuclease
MYYVYIIQSRKTKELYFGRTSDLAIRIKEHNNGKNYSTKDDRPWLYIYVEGYKSEKDSINRELKLKHYGNARTYIKTRIKNSLLNE